MIRISDLSFGYNHQKKLFDKLNLEIPSGQIHGLLGLNGAGKSSLLHLIQGLRYTDGGSVLVGGEKPADRTVAFLQDAFLIPEEIYAPDMSITRYIDMYSPFYPAFSLESFLKFLNEFEIDRTAHLGKMSMGQKKKAIIAFGLATCAKLLMMDEPTNGLDIPSKKQFRKILSHIITNDRLFLISTHQIRDLHSLIDNVIVIKEGNIIFNHTMIDITEKLHFSLTSEAINGQKTIYSERVPGGYLNIKLSDGSTSFEPDAEVLFNAIITENEKINQAFSS